MPNQCGTSNPIDPDSIAASRSLEGVTLRRIPHNRLVSRTAVKRWVRSTGDRNPLWLDPEYAGRSALGRIVAPPCWLYTVDDTCVAPKLPDCHVIYGGCDWEFYHWVGEGETVQAQARLIDVQEKSGGFCGPMVLQTSEIEYSNSEGTLVAVATSRVLRTPRPEAVKAGKYRHWEKQALNPEGARAIEDAYDTEQIRGSQPRYWEDLQESDDLPPIVRGPLTSEEIIQFMGATRPSLGFKRFVRHRQRHSGAAFRDPETGSWESWEASMLRDDVAQMFGFPSAHDSGIDRISWVANLITNWMSDHGFLKSLGVTLTLPNVYGDTTWCRGRVTRLFRDNGQHLADLEVWCDNHRGQQTAHGKATVVLPSRKNPSREKLEDKS